MSPPATPSRAAAPAAPELPSAIHALGPEGTFSDQAARRLREALLGSERAPAAPLRYTHTIAEVLVAVERDPAAWGVFPIENSVAGIVAPAQDGLVAHNVHIFGEVAVRVRFSLLARGPLEAVQRFYAHPQAFDQCSEFLAARMPQAEVHFTRSNVDSGYRFLAELTDDADAGTDTGRSATGVTVIGAAAAIVPAEFAEVCAETHPELTTERDIQTYANNTTRFLAVRHGPSPEPPDFSRAKTSVCIEPDTDRPGLLFEILRIFHKHGVNLHRLESRPAKITPWTYVFFIDFTNNPASAECLAELRQTPNTIRVLGTYDGVE